MTLPGADCTERPSSLQQVADFSLRHPQCASVPPARAAHPVLSARKLGERGGQLSSTFFAIQCRPLLGAPLGTWRVLLRPACQHFMPQPVEGHDLAAGQAGLLWPAQRQLGAG